LSKVSPKVDQIDDENEEPSYFIDDESILAISNEKGSHLIKKKFVISKTKLSKSIMNSLRASPMRNYS